MAVLVVAVLVVGAAVLTSRGGGSGDTESPVPQAEPFTLAPVIAGQPAAVLSATPGHPVVLAFFASWCAPCTQELPLIEKLSRVRAGGPHAARRRQRKTRAFCRQRGDIGAAIAGPGQTVGTP